LLHSQRYLARRPRSIQHSELDYFVKIVMASDFTNRLQVTTRHAEQRKRELEGFAVGNTGSVLAIKERAGDFFDNNVCTLRHQFDLCLMASAQKYRHHNHYNKNSGGSDTSPERQ
jgi:hypothetical protein